jgi:hypothetical protein
MLDDDALFVVLGQPSVRYSSAFSPKMTVRRSQE